MHTTGQASFPTNLSKPFPRQPASIQALLSGQLTLPQVPMLVQHWESKDTTRCKSDTKETQTDTISTVMVLAASTGSLSPAQRIGEQAAQNPVGPWKRLGWRIWEGATHRGSVEEGIEPFTN